MAALPNCSIRQARRPAVALVAGALFVLPLLAPPAAARGPEAIADVAEQVIDAVVNISTSQKIEQRGGATPQLPPGSPFEEFFEEFFKNRRGPGGGDNAPNRGPRRVNSLGSGFIIDAQGIVITNNHVISDADEVTVILNNGERLKAEIVGRDQKTDLAVLKVKPERPLKSVKFGDSEVLRIGEWVIAIDTAIYSPSGGSIGIGFAVPSKNAVAVIDQLRQFGEMRRGWLGVRIQQVTDDIAESLGLKPARGALVAGVDDKGPAKPAGIEPGDVIVKFDGKDIKEMKDLPRIVADTPVGKDVPVVVVRKGKEESKTVKLGRLEDAEKVQAAAKTDNKDEDKSVVKKTLGLDLSNLTEDLRKRYKIKDSVKGVVITGVEGGSAAAEKRLSPGDVIVEVAQEAVSNADAVQKRIDALKKEGRKSALLLVANAEGELRFVALSLQ